MSYEEDIPSPVNLGNPDETSVIEIAQKIINLTNSNSQIVFRSLPADDPLQRKPDISQAQGILDWQPKVSLQEGLTETITYFDQLLSTAVYR